MSDSDILGKLLPNINVTVEDDHTNSEASLEPGEIFDSQNGAAKNEFSKTEIIRKWMDTLQRPERTYSNGNSGFETGLDMSSEVLVKKLHERAKRFGLKQEERNKITDVEINALYKSLGVNLDDSRSNFRLEVIHVRGVEKMSSNDVMSYFRNYGPSKIEWINDNSCNVYWNDKTSAARAILGVSKTDVLAVGGNKVKEECKDSPNKSSLDKDPIDENIDLTTIGKQTKIEPEGKDEDLMEIDEKANDKNKDIKYITPPVPVPPGLWRCDDSHPKSEYILLRFATKDDKKIPGAEKHSQYYQKYGNPNYGGMKGLLSTSRKRKFQASRNRQIINKFRGNSRNSSDTSSDYHRRSKTPRMKLYADEEESKVRKRRSSSGGYFTSCGSRSVKNRLGSRYTQDDLQQIGRQFSSDDEILENESSFTCKIPSRFNIWTDQAKRMAKEEYGSIDPLRDRYFKEKDRPIRDYSGYESFVPDSALLSSLSSSSLKQCRRCGNTSSSCSCPRSRISLSSVTLSSKSFGSTKNSNRNDSSFSSPYASHGEKNVFLRGRNERPHAQGDLRARIQELKRTQEKLSKHRSPLCIDDSE